jgi:hypothetical protein
MNYAPPLCLGSISGLHSWEKRVWRFPGSPDAHVDLCRDCHIARTTPSRVVVAENRSTKPLAFVVMMGADQRVVLEDIPPPESWSYPYE